MKRDGAKGRSINAFGLSFRCVRSKFTEQIRSFYTCSDSIFVLYDILLLSIITNIFFTWSKSVISSLPYVNKVLFHFHYAILIRLNFISLNERYIYLENC